MESEYTGAYAEFEDDRFLYLKYRFQPLEDDAFRYGQEKIESFQNIYKNDKAYQVYWERVYKLNENDIGNALELLRADYQEKIDRGIIADYQSRYGMNHLNENNNLYIKQYALEKTPLCNEQRNALQNDDFGIQKSNNSIKMDLKDVDDRVSPIKQSAYSNENKESALPIDNSISNEFSFVSKDSLQEKIAGKREHKGRSLEGDSKPIKMKNDARENSSSFLGL